MSTLTTLVIVLAVSASLGWLGGDFGTVVRVKLRDAETQILVCDEQLRVFLAFAWMAALVAGWWFGLVHGAIPIAGYVVLGAAWGIAESTSLYRLNKYHRN